MKRNHLLNISTPWFNGGFSISTNPVNKSGNKRSAVFSRQSLRVVIAVVFCLICVPQIAYPQEKTRKFAHIQFPEEIKAVKVTPRYAFAHSNNKIWRIDRDKLTIEEIAKIEGKSHFFGREPRPNPMTFGGAILWILTRMETFG